MTKILISGYIGHNNFGDELILKTITDTLKKNIEDVEITAISANPHSTSDSYKINSIYKYDCFGIIKNMLQTNWLITGGGSLLQDITSLKSLLYYLSLIILAKLCNKKVAAFAQGIGPIKSIPGAFLTKLILKQVNLIAVRDADSQNLLKSWNINSTLMADAAFNLQHKKTEKDNSSVQIGIQLRNWPTLTQEKLNILADSIIEKFNNNDVQINLISLQDSIDLKILEDLNSLLKRKNFKGNINVFSNLQIDATLNLIEKIDYMIAMRYHANIIAINLGIPTLAISYDPKVLSLATEAEIPFVEVDSLNQKELNQNIDNLIKNKNSYSKQVQNYANMQKSKTEAGFKQLINCLNEENKIAE